VHICTEQSGGWGESESYVDFSCINKVRNIAKIEMEEGHNSSRDLEDTHCHAMAHYLLLIAMEEEKRGMCRSHVNSMCVIACKRAQERLVYAPILDMLQEQVADDLERIHQMIE
jgi:hypothetical protein